MAATSRWGVSRETRFLLLTMVVSIAALLLLARFRFPDRGAVAVVGPPLERLAARATYEELAGVTAAAQPRIDRLVAVLKVERPAAQPHSIADLLERPSPLDVLPGFVPAVRVEPQAGLAFLPPGLDGRDLILGDQRVTVVSEDRLLGVALVNLPPAAGGNWSWAVEEAVVPGQYVLAVEGSRHGPVARPVFLARADELPSPGWDLLLLLGQPPLAEEGSLLFSLPGALMGLIVHHAGAAALVPAAALQAVADRLRQGEPAPAGDLGISVQALTGRLRAATGATEGGAVVTWVDPAGPAAGAVRVGDVITWLGGARTPTPAALLTAIVRAGPGASLSVTLIRDRVREEVTLQTVAHPVQPRTPGTADLGATLENRPGVGVEVVRVVPGGPADRAGLTPGDIVTGLAGRQAPRATDLTRAFARAQPGDAVLLGVLRGARRLVVALTR